MLALVLERLDHLDTLTAWIWTPEKDRPRRFPTSFRYPRPIRPAKKFATVEEIKRFFGSGVRHSGR